MKTVLMIPSWYPTKENQFAGSFFREQAIALQEHFNFIVLHFRERKTFFVLAAIKNFQKRKLPIINQEQNIIEYECDIYASIGSYFFCKFYDFIVKHVKHKTVEGVGLYYPESYISNRKKIIKKILAKNNLEFDYVYGVTAQDQAVISSIFSECSKKPFVLAEHAPFPWPGNVISNHTKNAIEKCNLFLAISHDKIRQVLLQNVRLKKINYIGNLIDETKFLHSPIPHDKKTFVIVAANSFYKNYDMFIKVFDELTSLTDVPFKVVVAGFGANKGYSRNADELIQKINLSKFADCVELVPFVPRNEMGQFLNRCDVFVLTSIQEGQPVAAMEAACCGLPVFSTRCGGIEDYIGVEEGRIFDLTDYKSFAASLADFLSDKISFDSEHIRENVVRRFGKKAFVSNFCEFFTQLDNEKT